MAGVVAAQPSRSTAYVAPRLSVHAARLARIFIFMCSFRNLAKNGALVNRFGGGNIMVSV